MAAKYRLRLTGGRVVGPFTKIQVRELFDKGHIKGQEQAQLFPIGEWAPLSAHKELISVLTESPKEESEKKSSGVTQTSHTVARMSLAKGAAQKKASEKKAQEEQEAALEAKKAKEDIQEEAKNKKPIEGEGTKSNFVEFVFNKEDESAVDYKALEEKYQTEKSEEANEGPDSTPSSQANETSADQDDEEGVEKTVILQRPMARQQNVDKTVIVNPKALAAIKEEEEPEEDYEKTKKEILPEEIPVDTSEATQMVVLSEVMRKIKTEAKDTQKELEQKLEQEESKLTQLTATTVLENDEDEEEEEKPRKGTRPIILVIILLLIAYLMMDEEKKAPELKPINVVVEFPIGDVKPNALKAEQDYNEALATYSYKYVDKLKSIKLLKDSLANKFDGSDALPWLLRVYAEVMENAQDPLKTRQVIFKLTQIARSKVLTDPNAALGTALFYQKNGKVHTARTTLENYLRLGNPTLDILAAYLNILIDAGDLIQALKVYERIEPIEKKPLKAYLAMARYLELEEKFDEAKKTLEEAGKFYGESVELLLLYSDYLVREGDTAKFKTVLENVQKLQADQSPTYTAMYLERMGILSAYIKEIDTAVKFFNTALELRESDELRSKLAALQRGGGNAAEKLILESRVIQLMKKAEQELRLSNWELAFTHAINAVDILESYIPSQLLLADIQLRRGYFESALGTLSKLKSNYPLNANVSFKFLEGLIKARKFVPAQDQVILIGQTSLKDLPEYNSYLGQYYYEIGNVNLAIKNYTMALKRDPLRDDDLFRLGKIYLLYKKYENSKQMITRAIELDPLNVDYVATYAKILYELDSADAAIGYLRNMLEKFPDNPRLLGDIATYYYRNGQLKQFETYKEKVAKLSAKDESFYRFLVNSAKLEGKIDKVIEYSKDLLKVAPGDMEARMLLGTYLLSNNRFADAYATFLDVRERLTSFPKVNYFLAKVMVKQKDYKKGLEFANKEVELNPALEFGHYIVGEVKRLQGDIAGAETSLEKAISINGRYVEALMSLGWIKRNQRLYEPARELYLRALKVELDNPEVHKELCLIYNEIGQNGLAIESCQTYLKLLPGAPDTRQIETLIQRMK